MNPNQRSCNGKNSYGYGFIINGCLEELSIATDWSELRRVQYCESWKQREEGIRSRFITEAVARFV